MNFTDKEIQAYTEAMDIMEACCTPEQDDDVLELFVIRLLEDCVTADDLKQQMVA